MPFSLNAGSQKWFDENPEAAKNAMSNMAIKRSGDPETDIGHTAVFLASPASNYITGVTINVDGGSSLLS